MKWLVQTVGGSPEPLLRAIATLRPDRVAFVCSGDRGGVRGSCGQVLGKGKVCGKPGEPPSLPNIPTQARLGEEQYSLSVYDADPDDLSQCYDRIAGLIQEIRRQDPDARIYCDYTGGTKSMSAALAMAALDDGQVRIMLVTGARRDLTRVEDGTEFLAPVRVESVLIRRLRREVDRLVCRYDYAGAEKILSTYLTDAPENEQARVWLLLCRAFDTWDGFDHARAMRLLSSAGDPRLAEHLQFLGRVSRTSGPAWKQEAGYLLAADILANAQRRAAQGRYDDAIARHYRALELVAQTFLWNEHAIDCGATSKEQVPAELPWKEGESDWPLKLGLVKAWDLAAALDGEIASLWSASKGRVLDALTRRNYGILAHGTVPATRDDCLQDSESGMGHLAREAMAIIGKRTPALPANLYPPDFPTAMPE